MCPNAHSHVVYNVHMTIALFVIVVSALCAGDKDFNIPSCWTRSLNSEPYRRELRFSPVPGLQKISILLTENRSEFIHLKMLHDDVWVEMDCSAHDLEHGTIFAVQVGCKRCRQRPGYVSSMPLDLYHRRFLVVEPAEKPATHFVQFDKTNAHDPSKLCEYRAEQEHFTITRFLCKYDDLSYSFVSAQVAYANIHNVVIEWGVRETCGSIHKRDRKEFNFPLCAHHDDRSRATSSLKTLI